LDLNVIGSSNGLASDDALEAQHGIYRIPSLIGKSSAHEKRTFSIAVS
jgi:hypothetical protein